MATTTFAPDGTPLYTFPPGVALAQGEDVLARGAVCVLRATAGGALVPMYDLRLQPISSVTTSQTLGAFPAFFAAAPAGVIDAGSVQLPISSIEAQAAGLAAEQKADALERLVNLLVTSLDGYVTEAELAAALAALPQPGSGGGGLTATDYARTLLQQGDAASARRHLEAGTSSLAVGTRATDAKAGDYEPVVANIGGSGTVGREVLRANTQAEARQAIGVSGSTSTGGGARLVAAVSFDDFFAGSTTDEKITAMNAWAQAHGGQPTPVVLFDTKRYSHVVPIRLYSGLKLQGTHGMAPMEFSRGTILAWAGAAGTSQLIFPPDGQTNQSYPSDGSPRNGSMEGIQFEGSASTTWMPDNAMTGSASDINGKTLWYWRFHNCSWKNFRKVWWGYTTGCDFATGKSFFQSIAETAIFLGGSETTVFGQDGYSFAASSASSQTASPFMRSNLSKSWIGMCMITARKVGYGLSIEGGYATEVMGLAHDAQDSDPFNGKMLQISGGTGHVVRGVSFKGGMNAPTSADRALLHVTGGTDLLIEGNKFNRRGTTYGADKAAIWVGPNVGLREVAVGLNTWPGFNDPTRIEESREGQVVLVDPRARTVVAA